MLKQYTFILGLFLSVIVFGQEKVIIRQQGFGKNTKLTLNFNDGMFELNTANEIIFEAELKLDKPIYGMIIQKNGKYAGFYIEPGATEVIIKKKGYPKSLEVPGSASHQVYHAVHHAKNRKAFSSAVLAHQDSPIALEQLELGFKFQRMSIEELQTLFDNLKPENQNRLPLLKAFLNTANIEKIIPGNPLYDFTAEDRNGNIFSTEDYRGDYLLIDFASTTCGPCWAGYPDMIELASEYNNLQVITYNEDFMVDQWKDFANRQRLRLPWPVLWYGQNKAEVFEIYNVEGWPLLFLVSPEGEVLDAWYGSTRNLLNKALKKHIK